LRSRSLTGDLVEAFLVAGGADVAMSAESDRDAQTGRRVAFVGIAASALLATLNIVVGVLSQSTSVVATGLEFAGDVLASTVVLLGMVVAVRPADDNHPYGHGRIETLSAFVVGMILALGGAGIAGIRSRRSVRGMRRRRPLPLSCWVWPSRFAVSCLRSSFVSAVEYAAPRSWPTPGTTR
jgi:hypothetical protein